MIGRSQGGDGILKLSGIIGEEGEVTISIEVGDIQMKVGAMFVHEIEMEQTTQT